MRLRKIKLDGTYDLFDYELNRTIAEVKEWARRPQIDPRRVDYNLFMADLWKSIADETFNYVNLNGSSIVLDKIEKTIFLGKSQDLQRISVLIGVSNGYYKHERELNVTINSPLGHGELAHQEIDEVLTKHNVLR